MKLDLLQLNTRQLLDLYHACASALERSDRGRRQTTHGHIVQEQLLVPVPKTALVADPPRTSK